MNPEKLYDIFTEALQNDNVRNELIGIMGSLNDEDRIDGQTELFPVNDPSEEIADLSRKNALLELEINRLENENKQLRLNNQKYSESLNLYCGTYAMQISLYEKYKTLSPSTARVMNGFLKNNTLSGIFLCGVIPENFNGIRDYTENLVINGYEEKKADIAVLNELYTYFLSCYNSTFGSPVYALTDVKAGDAFDERIHHNVGTAKHGSISRVLLQGCITTANSKVIRKAVVII